MKHRPPEYFERAAIRAERMSLWQVAEMNWKMAAEAAKARNPLPT